MKELTKLWKSCPRLHLYLTVSFVQSFECNESHLCGRCSPWTHCRTRRTCKLWIWMYFNLIASSLPLPRSSAVCAYLKFDLFRRYFSPANEHVVSCDRTKDDDDTNCVCIECEFLHDSFDVDQVWDCHGWSESKRSAEWASKWVSWESHLHEHIRTTSCVLCACDDEMSSVDSGQRSVISVALYCI